jgi:hypothetical protein
MKMHRFGLALPWLLLMLPVPGCNSNADLPTAPRIVQPTEGSANGPAGSMTDKRKAKKEKGLQGDAITPERARQ